MTTFVITSASKEYHSPSSQTHCGIVTLLSALHPTNAASPTSVTLFGITMPVMRLQSMNAQSPMRVTG